MFEGLMGDIWNTFTERFLRVQVFFNPPAQPPQPPAPGGNPAGPGTTPRRPTKRYNALGVLEDVAPDDGAEAGNGAMDVGPGEPPAPTPVARPDVVVAGAGRARPLGSPSPAASPGSWENVGRNDPCPCGSGKKFKKCHGASL